MAMVVVLPAPFGPTKPATTPLRQLEVEAVDDGAVAVALGEAVHGHGRGGGCHASTVRPIGGRRRPPRDG